MDSVDFKLVEAEQTELSSKRYWGIGSKIIKEFMASNHNRVEVKITLPKSGYSPYDVKQKLKTNIISLKLDDKVRVYVINKVVYLERLEPKSVESGLSDKMVYNGFELIEIKKKPRRVWTKPTLLVKHEYHVGSKYDPIFKAFLSSGKQLVKVTIDNDDRSPYLKAGALSQMAPENIRISVRNREIYLERLDLTQTDILPKTG